MIHDLAEVKTMFDDADKLIGERPELLSMQIDQIFDELNDGTQNMMHIRWGVMTRVKMREIIAYTVNDILDFMIGITERNLLCEYIGYVLQTEHNISLLELLIKANEKNIVKDIFPFVEACIEYEKNCLISQYDTILIILDSLEATQKIRFAHGYSSLILAEAEEEIVFEHYLKNYSKSSEFLIEYIIRKIYPSKAKLANTWLDRFINSDKKYCLIAGGYILRESLYYNVSTFEKYFFLVEEKIDMDQELWEHLIELYVLYFELGENEDYLDKVKERLVSIKVQGAKEKRICFNAMRYRIKKDNRLSEIFEEILSIPFEKDIYILEASDNYLCYMFGNNPLKAIDVMYQIYKLNDFRVESDFIAHLPLFYEKLVSNQDALLEIWWNKTLYGSNEEFFLSIEVFRKVLSLDKIDKYIKSKQATKADLINLLEGIVLFDIEDRKIAKLAFAFAPYIQDNEMFTNYCKEMILSNYPGSLFDEASQHINSGNEYKKYLACFIVNSYNEMHKKMQEGYKDKDFCPSHERSLLYQKYMVEKNNEMVKKAQDLSILGRLFPTRKMKYGKRFAFVQTIKGGQYYYKVAEYARNSVSAELPQSFINDPMRYTYMRTDYLMRREKNAVNN